MILAQPDFSLCQRGWPINYGQPVVENLGISVLRFPKLASNISPPSLTSSQPVVTDVFLTLVAEERDDVLNLVPIT